MLKGKYPLNLIERLGLEGHIFLKLSFNIKYVFPAIYVSLFSFLVPSVLYQGKWNSMSTIVLTVSLIGLIVNVILGSKVSALKSFSAILQPVWAYLTTIIFGVVSGISVRDWLLALVFVVFGAVCWWIISAGMANALRSILNGIDLAVRDQSQRINLRIKRNDEIGILASKLNRFFDEREKYLSVISEHAWVLDETSRDINTNFQASSQATEQVANAVEQVTRGSVEQARHLSEIAEIMKQVRQAVEQVATGAGDQGREIQDILELIKSIAGKMDETSQILVKAKETTVVNNQNAQNGVDAVKRTEEVMTQIKTSVLQTADKIRGLGEQSEKIGQIIQVIDDIAEQTNLLALNAAIEAARAGEHGKGFAVVADEVRKLAERCSKATKETADLITRIQHETDIAVKSTQTASEQVKVGEAQAQEAQLALNQIVQGAQNSSRNAGRTAEMIEEMLQDSKEIERAVTSVATVAVQNAAVSQQMTASAEQVDSAVGNIAATSQQNAAAAQEVAASTVELSNSVQEMASSSEKLSGVCQELRNLVIKYN
ncbi:MAG: methyl-accepting chemotaxis protein [Thermincola sp.]|jgi:methyl-accepting chemotaxis protein|nr:methyl-accepting chemotaxis protein [Thermincola sp.]MDT3704703.1 methyl-accepting chemotaxis protein [Thermincola sp.]